MNRQTSETQKGIIGALACYLLWGAFPLFWYPINQSDMPTMQVLAQRVAWSAVFAVACMLVFKQTQTVWQAVRQPKILLTFYASSLLIGSNWLIYLWAILNNHVVDASLGYFLNPLVNVLIGFLVLHEKLNKMQAASLILAASGIVWLAIPAGQIPWVALSLAASFSLYALIRKLAPMPALAGLTLETLLLLPFALAYLGYCAWQNQLYFGQLNSLQTSIIVLSGVATTIPLLLFASSAKRISLSLLGMLQYVSPTLQFALGLMLFGETLNASRLAGYGLVWCGVVVFLWGTWLAGRKASS